MKLKPGQLPKDHKRMNLNVEEDLHRQFKVATEMEGKNMTVVLTEFIEAYVQKHLPASIRRKLKE